MAFRRLTRSLSKSLDHPLAATTSTHLNDKKKKDRTASKKSQVTNQAASQDEMNIEFSCDQLDAALYQPADFLPICFQSQPRSAPSSQQQDDAGLIFDSELLLPSESTPTDFGWKYSCDEDSSPATQLDMVHGMDQILESSSLLYSPMSVPPVASPAAPSPQPKPEMNTAEDLLQFYFSTADAQPQSDEDEVSCNGIEDDRNSFADSCNDIEDDDLLGDLEDILSSYEKPNEKSDYADLSHIQISYNPPADTVELALSSQYEEGWFVTEQPSPAAPAEAAAATQSAPVAGPSRKGKTAAKKSAAPQPAASGTRGRKRKASIDSAADDDDRKRRQNAEAAKNYRKRKAEQMSKVFEEKEGVEKELEKARKKLSSKMNERNILLKMLYESYKENGQSAPHKILFPPWIETWYLKQNDD